MSNEDPNPFDDLAEETEDPDESGPVEETQSESIAQSESQPSAEQPPDRDDKSSAAISKSNTPMAEGSNASTDPSLEGPTLANSSPPFPYSEAQQKQMYVRDGLWDDLEDLAFDAELELRRTFDVRNVEQRELDTAVIQLVLNRMSAQEIAEMVVRMRGFDPTADE